jgi:hypothetical protein
MVKHESLLEVTKRTTGASGRELLSAAIVAVSFAIIALILWRMMQT